MTASAYLVNFRINLGDLAEVALIWPDNGIFHVSCTVRTKIARYVSYEYRQQKDVM